MATSLYCTPNANALQALEGAIAQVKGVLLDLDTWPSEKVIKPTDSLYTKIMRVASLLSDAASDVQKSGRAIGYIYPQRDRIMSDLDYHQKTGRQYWILPNSGMETDLEKVLHLSRVRNIVEDCFGMRN